MTSALFYWKVQMDVLFNKNPYYHSKKKSRGVMSNSIKYMSVSSSSPIDFEIKWHNSKSKKWYHCQGHGFELQKCYQGCNVECHKRLNCVFLSTNWFWGGVSRVTQLTIWQYRMRYIFSVMHRSHNLWKPEFQKETN